VAASRRNYNRMSRGRTLGGLAGAVQLGSSSCIFLFSPSLSIISPLSIYIRHNGFHESRYLRPARLYGRSFHHETGPPRLLFQEHCTPSPP
jgi:hypothetical protein